MIKTIYLLSITLMLIGVLSLIGGLFGLTFTYKNVAQEKIVTPSDASIPSTPVRGPLTLKAQADIIREHVLHNSTDGKTFAEMPRQIPQLDENGQVMLDKNGDTVMTANTARDIWITATTLITALNLGLMAYAIFGFAVLFGLFAMLAGLTGYLINKQNY